MNHVDTDVTAFFEEFERAGNTDDIDSTGRQFAEVFLSADPNGTTAVPRSLLVASMPQRRQMFASIGVGRTTLQSITQTDLDENYLLATTNWIAEIEGGDDLALSSTFMLRRSNESLQIVLYLNHLDIMATIADRLDVSPTP